MKINFKSVILSIAKIVVFAVPIFFGTSCQGISNTDTLVGLEENPPALSIGSVRIISGGKEHEPRRNWFHGFEPANNGETLSISGIHELPANIADELIPIPIKDDFQIIIEYEQHSRPIYYFHKLINYEWVLVLLVYPHDNLIFLVHDWEEWITEEITAESFVEVLEPGEYMLDVNVWWSNEIMGSAFQHFFRLINE